MTLYGMFGKLTARSGQRDALVDILLENAHAMADVGARVYIVNTGPAEPDAVWVYEVWDGKQAHDDSLKLDSVRSAIQRAVPLLAAPPESIELVPIAGAGLERN